VHLFLNENVKYTYLVTNFERAFILVIFNTILLWRVTKNTSSETLFPKILREEKYISE
jgi:hypothetical protein